MKNQEINMVTSPITASWSAAWNPDNPDRTFFENLKKIKEGGLIEFVQSDGSIIKCRVIKAVHLVDGVTIEFQIEK